MTLKSGRDMLVRIGDGGVPPVFTAAAGLRMKTISLNARTVDVTHADSAAAGANCSPGPG